MADEVELYKQYRPTTFKQVLGQPEAVKILEDLVKRKKVPHALLLTGGSGVGKTTIARILQDKLDCSDSDFFELNAADTKGIDTIRDIRQSMGYTPMQGSSRIWYVDECAKLTSDAQTCLLKMLEDTPSHVYFILSTTDPQKVIKTIHTRCTEIKLSSLTPKDIEDLLVSVSTKEKTKVPQEVIDRIVEVAEGSARKALVILHQVIGLKTEQEQLDAVQNSESRQQAIEIARALLNPATRWPAMAKILKEVDTSDPEGIRYLVLAYASNVMLGGGGNLLDRAYLIICAFEGNFYDSKKAGLVRACWEVIGKK